ncbi:hypothetical protein PM082_001417 [Marasmius tenuissimus]|nr:hypothetical protein PM082_001417 [Marasmius tenuissimus]
MAKAEDIKPCQRCQDCDDYESNDSDSEPDRARVPCKNCGCKKKEHIAAKGRGKKSSGGLSVPAIFKKVFAEKTDEEAADLLSSANQEAKDGLQSKNKKKGRKASEPNKASAGADKSYVLTSIYLNVEGTCIIPNPKDDSTKLIVPRSAAAITRHQWFEACSLGHAIQSAKIEIPPNASFRDIDTVIRENLPKPFEYFATSWKKDYPPYVFGYTEGHGRSAKIKLYQTTLEPNGQELRRLSEGPTGKGISSNQLILVSRKEIPPNVVSSWGTTNIAAVIDSDDDDYSYKVESPIPKASSKGKNDGRKYKRKISSDSDEATTDTDSKVVLRPRKKVAVKEEIEIDSDSDGFEVNMDEYGAIIQATTGGASDGGIEYAVGNDGRNAEDTTDDNFSFPFVATTPPRMEGQSSMDPYFSKPRPDDDPFSNKPNLDF